MKVQIELRDFLEMCDILDSLKDPNQEFNRCPGDLEDLISHAERLLNGKEKE
jgi:hypothetical protein